MASLTDLSSVTSSGTTLIGSFPLSARLFAIPSFLMLRIVAYVRKPLRVNVKEVSKPMPLELPVITATFFD